MKNWKYFEDVDFSDEKTIRFNIDTRDFYCQCLTIEDVKKLQKDGLSEDAAKDAETEAQAMTDKHIGLVEKLLVAKEKEIMSV